MKKLILIAAIANTLFVNGQTSIVIPPPIPVITGSCGAPQTGIYAAGSTIDPLLCAGSIVDFYTNAQDTTLIYLNFWISKPTSGPGVFDNITLIDA